MTIPVLMYHALYHQLEELSGADPVYAVSFETFRRHITLCQAAGRKITSLKRLMEMPEPISNDVCVFTFDDGHASNYEAAKILLEHGFSADLFINSAYIGDPDYLTAEQLKELADAGISIQSHSHEHLYISDLTKTQIREQLSQSQQRIEAITGHKVEIFAPPGGRVDGRVEQICRELGFSMLANSKPGLLKRRTNRLRIPRLPVLRSTSDTVMQSWVAPRPSRITPLKIKYYVTKIAKMLLGNQGYEKLRGALLN